MAHINKIDEMVKSHKINESYDTDKYGDYFMVLIDMYPQDLEKFDRLCPDLDYDADSFNITLQDMLGNNIDAKSISKVYYQSIFNTYVRDLVDRNRITEEESENINMTFNPIEFYYGNDEFRTTQELMRIVTKYRAVKSQRR